MDFGIKLPWNSKVIGNHDDRVESEEENEPVPTILKISETSELSILLLCHLEYAIVKENMGRRLWRLILVSWYQIRSNLRERKYRI